MAACKSRLDQGEEMDDRSEVEDFARRRLSLPEIEEFGHQRLGDVFVLADFLFIHCEHVAVLASRGAGESHGFERVPLRENNNSGVAPAKPESGWIQP